MAASLLSLPAIPSSAREWFATPTGNGNRNAESWENAGAAGGLQAVLDQMDSGDCLRLGGGEFRDLRLTLKRSGTPDRPIVLVGEDRGNGLPIFSSTWTISSPKQGPTAFTFDAGVSHITIRDIRVRGYQHAVRAAYVEGDVLRTALQFVNVDMEQIRHGFYLSGITGLIIAECDLKRYSKHGFRFDAGCSDVKVHRCTADCSEGDPTWEKQTEAFPFGFIVNDSGLPNRNFVFEDCASLHNLMPLQTTRYKNGDGFVVEGNSENVAFKRCRAVRNQDGGFDLKVKEVSLESCVAFENKRDFRIWKSGRLENCFAGWSQAGIWTQEGPVVAEHCTIAGWKNSPVQAEDAKIGIELRKCLVASDGAAQGSEGSWKGVTLVDSVEAPDLAAAGLQPPPENWNGAGPAMNSSRHPAKGYRSTIR